MHTGKGLRFSSRICLGLVAGLLVACGSDTPSFQETGLTRLVDAATSSDEATDEQSERTIIAPYSQDAVAETADEVPDTEEEAVFKVSAEEPQLRFGKETTVLSSSFADEKVDDVTYTVEAPAGKNPGRIINGNVYESPSSGSEAYEVTITARSASNPDYVAVQKVSLIPASQVFVGCTKESNKFPIEAKVYAIPTNTKKLPDFAKLPANTAVTACMDGFQVANRAWSDGFPGHPDLIEWFALKATTTLIVSKAGNYSFKLNSDDGAKLYIDGKLVIDNDGQHAVQAKTGSANLSAGEHELVIEYFQGPRYHIALELFWKLPAESYTYIPTSQFQAK